MIWQHSIALTVGLGLTVCSAVATDFYFISSRDSLAGMSGFEIYRYLDGEQTRLSNSDQVEQHPSYSRVNDRVYFSRLAASGHEEVFSMDPLGGDIIQITTDAGAADVTSNSHPFLAIDEQSLFITSGLGNGNSVVRHIDLEGNVIGIVIDHPSSVGHSPIATTPDGDKIYFSSKLDGDFEIFRANLDGTGEQQLTMNAIYDSGAAVSVDGSLVAFTRQDAADPCVSQIWIMSHDGGGQTQVTTQGLGLKWAFGWDAGRILYASNETGSQAIYSINTDGSDQTLLVSSVGNDMHLLPDNLCGYPGPDLELQANPDEPAVGEAVEFTLDADGVEFEDYRWKFGDGHEATTTMPKVSHTYGEADLFTVSVVAKDNCTRPNEYISDPLQLEVQGCSWDLDSNGVVNGTDLILMLGSWGVPYGTADLIALLGAWGLCP